MAAIPLIAAASAVSAFGAIKQGQAQQAQYESAANAANYNAIVAAQNAQVAGAQASAQEEQQRRQFRELQAKGIVAAAESGAGMDGSNADVLRENAIANELDALTIRYQGQMKARGLMADAELGRLDASAKRSAGSAAMTAGYLNAGASILSGASKAYGAMKAPAGGAPYSGVW